MNFWNIHPDAQQELEDVLDHYLGIDNELADSFNEHYHEHYQRYRRQICQEPLLYNLREGVARRVNLTPKFGEYYIAYMTWRQKIVLAIAHAKRSPYYWRDRIQDSKELF